LNRPAFTVLFNGALCAHKPNQKGEYLRMKLTKQGDIKIMKQLMEGWRQFVKQHEQMEKEDIFPGITHLDRLSKGIALAEQDDDEDFLLDSPDDDELEEGGNYNHCPDGKFGCANQKGSIYSMSKDGARRAGIDTSYVGRGVQTGNRDEKGKPKFKSAFGQATGDKACGRVDLRKGAISPKYSCGKYSSKYGVKEALKLVDGYLENLNINEANQDQTLQWCRSQGMKSFREWLLGFNQAVKASKGELGKS
jgi:hypothetical protein